MENVVQNNFKAVIDFIQHDSRYASHGRVVVGHARDAAEAIQRIQRKFAPEPGDSCMIQSIERLGRETF